VTGSDRFRSYRLAMPNKLFHAISAGVPTVATDVGVLAETVREHGVGTLYRPGDPASLKRAVQDLLDGYAGYVNAVRRAAGTLSWSVDERVLLDVYAGLQREPASRT
jgi:glycosyltransferase involved in cell wall biosynthesis